MTVKFIVDFIINNFETIRNIAVFLASAFVLIGLGIFYLKVFLNFNKVKEINKKIEEWHEKLGQVEIDNIRGVDEVYWKIDLGHEARNQKRLEQEIQKLNREKNSLLEEISIFKIFKK